MLQIDPMQFLMQAGGLFVWICLVAIVYAVVEKALGGPAAPDEPTRMWPARLESESGPARSCVAGPQVLEQTKIICPSP